MDGDTIVIGADDDGDNFSFFGSAYVFTRSGTSWSEQEKLTASDAAPNQNFGVSVAVDGDTAVIGAMTDDMGGNSGSAYVFALFLVANAPPTAIAGPDQSIRTGETVSLDGSGSFDDNTPSASLIYAWSFSLRPAGSTATLTEADTAMPSFIADIAGTYFINLVVTDTAGLASVPDEVVISSNNLAPTAVAGENQLVIVGASVELDGSDSTDPEADPLTYSWAITSAPAGSIATLSDANAISTSFVPDILGMYDVTLIVSDPIGPGTPDTVEIVATTAETFAEFQIVAAEEIVVDLGPDDVTTEGNKNALRNFLTQAIVAIQVEDTTEAINKLEKAIARTDGCILRGSPDGNGPQRDWITDCTEQIAIFDSLNSALIALSP